MDEESGCVMRIDHTFTILKAYVVCYVTIGFIKRY